jgi:transcriptional regulator with XRE-family HTH domain
MKDRIVTFIENKGFLPAEFADQIGIQRSSLSHVLNGRNNPGFSFIQKILTTYPQINSRWLITGEGNMLNDNIQPRQA